MSTTATAATIRLGVDLASLQSGLQRAATIAEQQGQSIKAGLLKATDQAATGFNRLGESIQSMLNPFALATSAIGLTAGTASLGALIAQSIAAAESMEDLSKITGINVEQLSRFTTVAKMSGTEMNTVSDLIKKLSISAVDAYSGNEKLARSFQAIGISTADLKTIAPDELLIRVAKGIEGIDPMVLQDLLAQLGGRGASNALVFLRELSERIDQTGVKISTQFAKDAGEFNDNITIMRDNIQSLANSLTAQLLPGLNAVLGAMNNGAGPVEAFFAKAGLNLNDDLWGQLAVIEKRLNDAAYSRAQSDDPGEWQGNMRRLEIQKQILLNEINRREAQINPSTDLAKTAAARSAALANGSSGSASGDSFIQALQARIEKADQGEFAMLRLQAAEKGVLNAADPLIEKLKELDIGRAIASYEQTLQTQNDELEFQIGLIGKSAREVQLLNAQRKIELELAKQIDQITRTKGGLSPEAIQQMRLSADVAIAISESSIGRRIELESKWQTGARSAFQKYQDDAINVAKSTEESFTRAFRGMEDAIVNFAMTGQLNFTNLANGIISDIIRIQARAATAGLANMLGSLIGKAVGSMFMPDAGGQHSVQGNADYVYDLHNGGIAGQGGSSRYLRDMSLFTNAPRYHNGGVAGLKPNEVPAVLLKGERVLPKGASVGSPTVNLNVYTDSGDKVEAQQRATMNESGGFDIDLFIRKAMTEDVRKNGSFTQMLSHTFGLRRTTS